MSKFKPVFVFVPGSWHTPEYLSSIISALSGQDYTCLCVSLPSNNVRSSKGVEFNEDVTAVRDVVAKLVVDEEKEVIVAMHSYGGMVGSEALEGLDKIERSEKGQGGGVVRLVYITALLFPEGTQLSPRGSFGSVPSWLEVNEETESLTPVPSMAGQIFYNDLSDAEARKWAAKLVPQSCRVWRTPTTYAAWRYIPSIAIVATNDLAAPYAGRLLKAAMESQSSMIDTVETVEGGHSPMLSHADWLVGVLRSAAGKADTCDAGACHCLNVLDF